MAKFNDGDTIEWYGKRYKVIGILGSEMRINEVDASGNLKHDGDYVISQGDTHVKSLANSVRTTNSVVANALAANAKRVATNREIPAQTAIDYFKKLVAEMDSLDNKIRPLVSRFKTLVGDGNTSSMDFPDRKIVGNPEELRELNKLKKRFEELRDFAKMTMGI